MGKPLNYNAPLPDFDADTQVDVETYLPQAARRALAHQHADTPCIDWQGFNKPSEY